MMNYSQTHIDRTIEKRPIIKLAKRSRLMGQLLKNLRHGWKTSDPTPGRVRIWKMWRCSIEHGFPHRIVESSVLLAEGASWVAWVRARNELSYTIKPLKPAMELVAMPTIHSENIIYDLLLMSKFWFVTLFFYLRMHFENLFRSSRMVLVLKSCSSGKR